MALHRSLIAVLGRTNPAIFDVVFPHGPVGIRQVAGRVEVELNPQPLPPIARAASELNPQPLPPGPELGALVAHELVRAAGLARALGVTLKVTTDDICPPPRGPWPWPFPWPGPWPGPWRDDEWETFTTGFALGLGATLEATSEVWERFDDAVLLKDLHGVAEQIVTKRFG